MKSFTSLVLIFIFCLSGLQAQKITQTIRGRIVEAGSGKAIEDAVINLEDLPAFPEVRTNSDGIFKMEEVPSGRHRLTVVHPVYLPYSIPDLVVNAGKETVLQIKLDVKVYETETVNITSSNHSIDRVSTNLLTVEESKRFAAVYFDPARVATSLPGVVQDNDQANHLVVRGNSPNGMLWRLEGIDIVNPNHLTNAGTFSDRLTQSGGGTIILSTQLLGNSTFSSGAFDAQYGNALSGVFDINFREGNEENYEFTAQAGLIGIDLAAEGPLNREKGSSFLVNYRYSTVGLLTNLGVDVGDEDITYQDLSFKLNLPTAKSGTFQLFGIGGLSSNFFEGAREDSLIEEQKDRFDISFTSDMGAIGASHELVIGEKTLWRSVVALSALNSSRTGELLNGNFEAEPFEEDQITQSRLSFSSTLSHQSNEKLNLSGGLYLNRIGYTLLSQVKAEGSSDAFRLLTQADGNGWLLQPYAKLSYQASPQLQFTAGLHAMHFFLNDRSSIEPRLSIGFRPAARHQLRLAYGLHSQLQLPGTYFSAISDSLGNLSFPNQNLDFTKAHHVVLSYRFNALQNLSIRIEPYFQRLFNVPIVDATDRTFSVLNLLEGNVSEALTNAGTGTNYGVELTVEKLLSQNYYFLISGAWYESLYTAGDGIQRDTRFNGNYMLSATAGYEWERYNKKGKQGIFGLNLRTLYRGGFRGMPIDVAASVAQNRTVFIESNGFTESFGDFFRIDLRFTFKRNKPNYTSTLGIDVQNLLNTQNIAYQAFDFVQESVITKYQFGLLPLLSYRWEF